MQNFYTFITVVAGTLLGFLLKNFWPKYFEAKGTNLATKEDIGEITKIVEDAKQQFTHDTEVLKGKLTIYSQSFVSIKSLERDALINVAKTYADWLNSLENFNLAFHSYDNYELLKKNDFYFSEKRIAFLNAKDHLYLFMHDEDIRNILQKLDSGALDLEGSISQFITKFMLNCRLRNAACENKTDNEIFALTTEYHKLEESIVQEQLNERNRLIKVFYNDYVNFIKIVSYRINLLIQ
jgi:hypothetical protein